MTAAGPWSVKGIDPKAREIAKDMARRSGQTLGDWLNQKIIEGEHGDPEAAAVSPRRGIEVLYREAQAALRGPATPLSVVDPDGMRLARSVEALASRVEAGEHRASLAMSGIDQSMVGVLSRLDELDREHLATGARLSKSITEVRAAQAAIAERLRKAADDGVSAETLKALQAGLAKLVARMDEAGEGKATSEELMRRVERVETVMEASPAAYADAEKVETVLTRMAERLDQNDTKTDAALQSLHSSFADLDARLRSGEAKMSHLGGQDLERRFQNLARELTQRVDATRAELSQRLRAAAEGRIDKVEASLKELGGRVDVAEKHSAQTIDKIGREVMRVAHSLGERVEAVEQAGVDLEARTEARVAAVEARAAEVAESMASEMARAADTMEARLREADSAQAQALQKLGGEIERIAERLAERIAAADRRQAEAIDEVADKVSRIGTSFDLRHDQVSGEITDRIRASETRTAQLVLEARGRLSRAVEPEPAEPVAAFAPPPFVPAAPPEPSEPPEAQSHAAAPFAAAPFASSFPQEPPAAEAHLSNADPFAFPEPAFSKTTFSESDFSEPTAFPEPAAFSASAFSESDFSEPAAFPEPASFSTPGPAAPPAEPAWSAAFDPFAEPKASALDSPFDPDDDFAPAASRVPPEPVFAPTAFETQRVQAAAEAPEPEFEPFKPAFTAFSVSDFAPATAEVDASAEQRPEQLSTRQMLEAARQAARRAAVGKAAVLGKAMSLGKPAEPAPVEAPAPVPPPEAEAEAPAAAEAQPSRPFGITFPGLRKRETAPTLRTFVLASGIAGSLTALGVGAYLVGESANQGAAGMGEVAASSAAGESGVLAPAAAPNVAVALTPPLAAPANAAAPAPIAVRPAVSTMPSNAAELYTSAVARLESGDVTAVTDLRTAADGGSAQAQFYLAQLYDQGGAGLVKDPAEARRWTERAAEGGDPAAMYNLASYLYGGEGGAKDPAKAVDWFRKAAEHGVVNGQYNLAQLYEKGYGVPQSNADAYKWYLVAANAGDHDSRAAATALKPRLTAEALASAEHGAAAIQAGLASGVKTAAVAAPRTP